jgi:maleate cis-trans isomerase
MAPGVALSVPAIPRHQLGYVSPLAVVDAMYYEFYQTAPSGIVFIAQPLPLKSFASASANASLQKAPAAIDTLAGRGAHRIVFGGIPLSALAGRRRMLALMQEEEQRAGVRVTSDFEDAVAALQFFSARKVAIAAKWKPQVMHAVRNYLADAGFDVLGSHGSNYDAREVMAINTVDSVDLALDLGRAALAAHRDADALLLGGGTWLSIPASMILENEFDRPVVSNMTACFWNALRQFGRTAAGHDRCRLLNTPPTSA